MAAMHRRTNPYVASGYPVRVSRIGAINIIIASQSAAVQFGDRGETCADLQAIAVQRQSDHASAGDVYFEAYSIFSRPLPRLIDPDYDQKQIVELKRINLSPHITVGSIRIIAVGSSASVQAGNGMKLSAVSRIKHIRQYARPLPVPPMHC
ncbi:hypothetical protein D3C78_1303140 [compost metagenome]